MYLFLFRNTKKSFLIRYTIKIVAKISNLKKYQHFDEKVSVKNLDDCFMVFFTYWDKGVNSCTALYSGNLPESFHGNNKTSIEKLTNFKRLSTAISSGKYQTYTKTK